jgi:KaiC/GvpD/RAD55 family RecA-like ATPase
MYGEKGVFVTLEESPEQLRQNMANLDWDIEQLEREDKLILLDASAGRIGFSSDEKFVVSRPYTLDSLLYDIRKCIKHINAKRVVLDCVDTMEIIVKSAEDFRTNLAKLNFLLKSFNCTALLITESVDIRKPSRRGIEEFTVDGVIMLHNSLHEYVSNETTVEQNMLGENRIEEAASMEVRSNKIEISKMRGTNHSRYLHPFIIARGGIQVNPNPNIVKNKSKSIYGVKRVE